MADQVWGTGYGSKRHLINNETRRGKDEPRRQWGRDRYAESQCSSTIFLSFFSDVEGEEEQVMSKPACPRCAKKAALLVCPTCKGAGTVES